MKVIVETSEAWPVYSLRDDLPPDWCGTRIELTEDEYRDYLMVQSQWMSWQYYIGRCQAEARKRQQQPLVCEQCNIEIRPEGGHLCDECGRDV